MDLVASLDHAFSHAHGVIAGVRPDQYDATTPCDDWSVRDLMQHMIGVVAGVGAAASGTAPAGGEAGLSDDPVGQFDQASAAALAAWRAPGVMDRELMSGAGPMPGRVLAGINLLDTATHTWDLARATGQDAHLPDDVAAAALELSRQTITPEIRPGRFKPEITPPDGTDDTGRLVAFLGRQP